MPSPDKVVVRNHWRDVFDGELPQGWAPTMTVSVVIPAYNSATLPLTLASLAAQDYPQELLEVIVVDDGSQPGFEPGAVVPQNLRVIRASEGWGRANAVEIGVRASGGEIIYWVDSDMILFHDNVRQHAKWAHFIPEAATIGEKGFVAEWDITPEQVFEEVASGAIAHRWEGKTLPPHWSEQVFAETDDLNDTDGRNYSTHMGACATVTRLVYERTGGHDVALKLGEDTEIAYRIWQAGGVFIPARDAQSWHLGRATIDTHREAVTRINDASFAQRMPIPRYRRTTENRTWDVPLVQVVISVEPAQARYARTAVDLLLNSTLTDLRIDLVAPWELLEGGRRKVLADPHEDLRVLSEWLRGEARVRMTDTRPMYPFPSPYRLDLAPEVGFTSDALRELYTTIDRVRVGVLSFAAPSPDLGSITMWDGAALSRARAYSTTDRSLEEAVDLVWGSVVSSAPLPGTFDLRMAPSIDKIRRRDPRVDDLDRRAALLTSRARAVENELTSNRTRIHELEGLVRDLQSRNPTRIFRARRHRLADDARPQGR